jgi:hypothetical protein
MSVWFSSRRTLPRDAQLSSAPDTIWDTLRLEGINADRGWQAELAFESEYLILGGSHAMDQSTDVGTEAARQALAAERIRSGRVLGMLRFVGISIACTLNLLLPEVLHETRALQANVGLSCRSTRNELRPAAALQSRHERLNRQGPEADDATALVPRHERGRRDDEGRKSRGRRGVP